MATQKSELSFDNEEKFFAWKEREESQNFAYFSKERGAIKSSLCIHQTYACQRDGSSRSHKAKGCPARKTSRRMSKGCVKTDITCPARIITAKCLDTGKVKVTYYRSHSHPLLSSDIQYHPLPLKLREDLKVKLAFGVCVEDIQKDLARPNHSNIENLTVFKKQINISRHHMQQIKRNMMKRAEKGPEGVDSISNLAILLERHRGEGHNPIILYQPEGGQYMIGNIESDAMTKDSPLVIGIQTKQQMHLLQLLTIKYLCVDSMQFQDYLLLNVGIRDEYGKGGPVAHLICNPDDQAAIVYFFQALCNDCNRSALTGVVTDENTTCINIIYAVFGNNLTHTLCKRHIHDDWLQLLRGTVVDKELRRQIYASLVMLMEEPSMSQFTIMTSKFVDKYRLKAKTFIKYFKDCFLDRCPLWASCYGINTSTVSNMYVYDDSFHKPLKEFLADETAGKELFDLIGFIVNITDDNSQQSVYPNCLEARITNTVTLEHEESMQIPDGSVAQVKAKTFSVQGESPVLVRKVKKLCLDPSCSYHCLKASCVELCPHLYSCTCGDESNLCTHIHKVHMHMQVHLLTKIRGQLTETVQRAAVVQTAPTLSFSQRLRRSPRHVREETQPQQSQPEETVSGSQTGPLLDNRREVHGVENYDDDDDGDDNFLPDMDNDAQEDEHDAADAHLLFNADPVPIEEDETSEASLKKILDVNDKLLLLLENKTVQSNLLPYILKELTSIVTKCKEQLPSYAVSDQAMRRRPKRKAAPLPLFQMKMRDVGSKPGIQGNSVNQDVVLENQVAHPQISRSHPTSASTSSVMSDLLSYAMSSSSASQASGPVYMVPATSNAPMPLSCEVMTVIGSSPVPPVLSAPPSTNIQTMHSVPIASASVMSEPNHVPTEALQPLATTMQQPQRHILPPIPAPNIPDLTSLSSQLVSSLPPALSVPLTSHIYQQETDYLHTQPSLSSAGTVMVTELLQRTSASSYPIPIQQLPTMDHSALITTQASQSLTLPGGSLPGAITNHQTGTPGSYLTPQLGGHRMMPSQPIAQPLPSPHTLASAGQPLTSVHQGTLPLQQSRQYLPSSNQNLTPLQPHTFIPFVQSLPHLTSTPPAPPQGQQVPQTEPQRQPQHPIY